MAKIGVLGGTFDPIHNAHLSLGKQALKEYNLDKVLVVPNYIPWMKSDRKITDEADRIHMVELAIEDLTQFELSLVEIKAGGESYTYKTLETLKDENPEDEFYFILGADSLNNIEKWKNPDIIFKLCTVLAAIRDDVDLEGLEKQKQYLEDKFKVKISFLHTDLMCVSSTEIRNDLKQYYALANKDMQGEECNLGYHFMDICESLDEFLPTKVLEYILENRLYEE